MKELWKLQTLCHTNTLEWLHYVRKCHHFQCHNVASRAWRYWGLWKSKDDSGSSKFFPGADTSRFISLILSAPGYKYVNLIRWEEQLLLLSTTVAHNCHTWLLTADCYEINHCHKIAMIAHSRLLNEINEFSPDCDEIKEFLPDCYEINHFHQIAMK